MVNNRSEIVRAHIWVKGHVQGVGFRAHVEYHALRMGALGWVRNVGFDTVEAIVEGTREVAERFIQMIKRGPRMSHIDELKVEWEAATGEFAGFMVNQNI